MSQQKILFPKLDTGVSGYQYPGSSNLSDRRCDEKPAHRVFRTKRKHVQRACERCRVKKAKCDGLQPCSRCVTYNQACIFRDRKATQEKVYSRGFVEMLISQHAVHVQALRDLYKRCVRREGFPGLPLQESIQGCPGTHAILDRLGLIKHAEEAVENPQRVLEDLVNFIKCLDSASDCGLDSAESTTDSISDTTVSEELSPEPNTPRESPDLAVASTAAAASSSTWSEIAHHPSATFMPMTSRGSMSESLGYMTGQSGFPDGYFDAQAQTFATGLVQRQHLLKQQHQRQLRHSIDYGLLNSGGQYDYFYHSVMSSRALV
ncbi:C6 transcription factor, putative [Talaromyces marneffei ATCC 18224]|uniref:C6 transcription factor, putative n=1 Tax=Talaromyces marneffei (strain ATCC 18224 / CBS 334.59 / QM 7333) TaxID=441960 RepID=B6QAX1_TALMQ|nr:C6 transcription factor, putative [Talaromyces marneffei ATCC 18224]